MNEDPPLSSAVELSSALIQLAALSERGKTVAACVPYTKRRLEWIMAQIENYVDEEDSYIVKDLFPDKKKRVHTWKVTPSKLIPFPARDDEPFEKGLVVLSLWQGNNGEWSSMFYRAQVVKTPELTDNEVQIRYEGSDNVTYNVSKSKVIPFEPLSKLRKGGRSRDGNLRGSTSPPDSPFHDSSSPSSDSSSERKPTYSNHKTIDGMKRTDMDSPRMTNKQPAPKRPKSNSMMSSPSSSSSSSSTALSPMDEVHQALNWIHSSSLYRPEDSTHHGVIEKKLRFMRSILLERQRQFQHPIPPPPSIS